MKQLLSFLLTLIVFSCSQKRESIKSLEGPSFIKANESDSIWATWVSHSLHSFQMLELKDSSNALVYCFEEGRQQLKNKPYFFKAVGKVTYWNKNKLTVHTDKYTFYYNIGDDTLILRGGAGGADIIEKLIRVTNDTVGRSVLK